MKNLIISIYPISKNILEQIENSLSIASTKTLSLNQLKSHSKINLIKYLITLKYERIYIVVSEHEYQPLLPIVLLLTTFIPYKEVYVSDFKGVVLKKNRFSILINEPVKIIFGSLSGFYYLLKSKLWVCILSKKKRMDLKTNQPQLNVAYLKTNLWFGVQAGGSIGHIRGVVNGLVALGAKVCLLSVEKVSGISKSTQVFNIRGNRFNGIPLEANSHSYNFSFLDKALKHVPESNCNVIYQRLCLNNFTGVLLSRKLKLPLITEYNGSEVWVQANWGKGLIFKDLARQIEDIVLNHSHLIITISKVLEDELIERGVDRKRIVFYPNCIDEQVFNPSNFPSSEQNSLRKKLNLDPDSKIVTFIGTFGKWHGVIYLAEVIKEFITNQEDWLKSNKVHFLLIGDGTCMPDVKKALSNSAFSPYYTLTGLIPQDEAPLYLAISDIFISPHVPNDDGTKFFGSPTKLFEYMAMQKPIIASSLDQIEDILSPHIKIQDNKVLPPSTKNEELAILTPPNSIQDKIKAIKYIFENEKNAIRMGQNARKKALTSYTWTNHVEKIVEKYRSL